MKTTTWTAIRTDRGLNAAHRGAALACATKPNGTSPMTFVPSTYVADQESHPPREWCV